MTHCEVTTWDGVEYRCRSVDPVNDSGRHRGERGDVVACAACEPVGGAEAGRPPLAASPAQPHSVRVVVTLVGVPYERRGDDHHAPFVAWPAGWPIPPVGAPVSLRRADGPFVVRLVEWCPEGAGLGPFVHLVIGRPEP